MTIEFNLFIFIYLFIDRFQFNLRNSKEKENEKKKSDCNQAKLLSDDGHSGFRPEWKQLQLTVIKFHIHHSLIENGKEDEEKVAVAVVVILKYRV